MQQTLFGTQNDQPTPEAGVQLDRLVSRSVSLIQCWVEAWGLDQVAVGYSGGKDSGVLLHIARSVYPAIPGVHALTGLDYLEIVAMAKNTPNIHIVRPRKPFHRVVQEHGWPVISKTVARFVSDCQNANPKNARTVHLRMTGETSTGKMAPTQKLPECWKYLITAPFKLSDSCCYHLKHGPLERYYKKTGLRPMIGVMRSDSNRRDKMITQHGCNMYDIKLPVSYPLADWTDADIWAYTRKHNVPYASVYDRGEKRTGCVFCMFGIMYDPERFLRLKKNSPAQYDFVINKLGGDKVLDYLGVKYK